MVAFLLNQEEHDEKVTRISEKLLDKVYTQDFNLFVQDKE